MPKRELWRENPLPINEETDLTLEEKIQRFHEFMTSLDERLVAIASDYNGLRAIVDMY